MSEFADKKKETELIARKLMLCAGLTNDLGLEYGKMGVTIFFYRYYRLTGNPIIEHFAYELLEELFDCMKDYQYDFREKIFGIALGLDYLIQNKYIDLDNDIMRDLDSQAMEQIMSGASIDNGLYGAAYYILSRHRIKNNMLTLEYIKKINDAIQALDINQECYFLRAQINNLLIGNDYISPDIISVLLSNETNINHKYLGIKGGLAGVGLRLMQEIESS